MKAVEPAWHEFKANLIYAKRGLSPHFALHARVNELDGKSAWCEFQADGERWQARLTYQPSNIVPPEDVTPTGTRWELAGEMREFRLDVRRHPKEDPLGDPSEYDPDDRGGLQRFNVHFAPRWAGMHVRSSSGTVSEYNVPDGIEEAINAAIIGSNIEATRYPELLRLGVNAVGVPGWNFDRLHEYSNIQDAERYVRVHKDASGPIHARDGPLAQMYHLLTSDRSGYRKLVENDTDEDGRNRPGYYSTVTLGPERIREAFPAHELPKEVKHYYSREAVSLDESNALSHPKLGASYQVSLHDETLRWGDLENLRDELDATVRAVLLEAGLDLAPQRDVGDFVPDAYFAADVLDGQPEPTVIDLDQLETTHESVVVRHLTDGLSPVEWESLEMLVTDGGKVSPRDIADATDRHVDSVRRALRRLDDLVEQKYAEVGLRSTRVAELVHEAVQEARDATRRAVEASAKAIDAAERGRDSAAAEFYAWAERHRVDVSRRNDNLTLDFSDYSDNVNRAVKTGYRLWKATRHDASRFLSAQILLGDGRDSRGHYSVPPG
jgi:ribosomal protein S18